MGVDARIAVKFSPKPTEKRIKELQYHLMHRFGTDIFWTRTFAGKDDPNAKDGWKVQDFIQRVEDGQYYFDTDQDMTGYWEVSMYCRYYGEGYERGPGLEIAGVLYYLADQPDVFEVWYGGDSSGTAGERFDREKALEFFQQFCRNGRLAYGRYFNHHDEGVNPPCDYCQIEMIRNGSGGRYAAFYCAGCGAEIKLRDEAFDKWKAGLPYEPTAKRNAALGEKELPIF